MYSRAYFEGIVAQADGLKLVDNPYDVDTHTDEYTDWAVGYLDATTGQDTVGNA